MPRPRSPSDRPDGAPLVSAGRLPARRRGPAAAAATGLVVLGLLGAALLAPGSAGVLRGTEQAVRSLQAAVTLDAAAVQPAAVPAPAGSAAPPDPARARAARGRAAAEDASVGLARTAALLAAGQPREALEQYTQVVGALALVPGDEVRRAALDARARQLRERLVATLRTGGV